MNVALIGYGLAGRNFHAPLISKCPELNLIRIMSSRMQEVKENYPQVDVVQDFSACLQDDVDLIVIATPNYLHFKQTQQALMAGKHVVVDKPMTESSLEAKQLIELAKKMEKTLSVFHNRRWDGDFLTLKELKSQVGEVVYFESNFHRFRPEVDQNNWRETTDYAGGIFYDLAPHLIDQCVNLFGLPNFIFCDLNFQRSNAKTDDYFHMILEYDKMRAHLNASTVVSFPRERFLLQGLKGSFGKFGLDQQEKQLTLANPTFTDEVFLAHKGDNVTCQKGDYLAFYQNVADHILGQADLAVTPEQALQVLELIELGIKSHQENQKIAVNS